MNICPIESPKKLNSVACTIGIIRPGSMKKRKCIVNTCLLVLQSMCSMSRLILVQIIRKRKYIMNIFQIESPKKLNSIACSIGIIRLSSVKTRKGPISTCLLVL